MKFENIHDTIAKQVFEKASTEARTRRKVEKFIRKRYEAHQLRGAKLSRDDVDYIQPYINQVNISAGESDFIEKARKSLIAARNRNRAIVAGVIIFLLGSTAFSLLQWRKAIEQKGVADKQTIKAKEAQQADSLKAIELGIALKEAEAAKDTAEIARIKAEQEKLRADTQANEALRQKNQAQKSAAETKSLALASIAKNLPISEIEKSLRILQTAYQKTYPEPPPAVVSQLLSEKFYQQIAQDKYEVDEFEAEFRESGKQLGHPLAIHFDHIGNIKGYDLSTDESLLLTYGEDSLIKVWTITGDLLLTLDQHKNDITSAEFSQDGKYILSSSFDDTSKLWNQKEEVLATMSMIEDRERLRNRLYKASFSPAGTHILTQVQDSLKIWDLAGNKIADIYGDWPKLGKDFILTQLDSELSTWDYKGNKLVSFEEHESQIYDTYLSPDGSSILSISEDGVIKHWDKNGRLYFTQDMQPDSSQGVNGYGISASYSEGGEFLLLEISQSQRALRSGHDRGLCSYKLLKKDGTEIRSFSSNLASFVDDPGFLTSINFDKGKIHIEYIDQKGEREQHYFSSDFIDSSPKHLKLSPNNQSIYFSNKGYQIFRLDTFQRNGQLILATQQFEIPNEVRYSEYLSGISEDQDFHIFLKLYLAPNHSHVYDGDGKLLGEDLIGRFIQFTKFGGLLTQESNKLRLYYPRGLLLHRESPFMGVNQHQISGHLLQELKENHNLSEIIPNESRNIIYGNSSDAWMVWDKFGTLLSKIPSKEFKTRGIEFFKKGEYFLFEGNFENDVILWDFKNNSSHRLQHSKNLETASISPNEEYIATFEKSGGKWKLWNKKGNLIFEKDLNTQKIGELRFSPDNNYILIRDYDKSISLWNLNGKQIFQKGPFPHFVRNAIFSPDGKEILINYSKELFGFSLEGREKRHQHFDQEIYTAGYSNLGTYVWIELENNQVLIQNRKGKYIKTFEGKDPIFSPGDQMILTNTEGLTAQKLWDISGKLIEGFEYPRSFLGFSPNDDSYAVAMDGDQVIQVFNKNAETLLDIPYALEQNYNGYSPDGQFILTRNQKNELQYWPLPNRIFRFLQEEARFPQLSEEDKKYYRIESSP